MQKRKIPDDKGTFLISLCLRKGINTPYLQRFLICLLPWNKPVFVAQNKDIKLLTNYDKWKDFSIFKLWFNCIFSNFLVSAYDVYSHFNTSLFIFIPCYHHSGKYCFVFQSTEVPQYFAIKKNSQQLYWTQKTKQSLISVSFTDIMIGKCC